MRKVSLIFLIIISFLLMVNDVKAIGKDEIDYEITSFEVNSSTKKVTVKGWAIIGGHNNYGGVLTNIKLEAKSASRSMTYTANLTLQNTSLNYGSNTNYSGNNYCYQRECTPALDENGNSSTDPHTGNTWITDKYNPARWTYKGDCFYRNMYFTATFDIEQLKYLGSGVYFNLVVEYNTALDNIDKCSVNNSDRATASNILSAINNGSYRWGYNSSKSKNITVDENRCKVNGNNCQSVNRLTINGDTVDLKITNTGSIFRLHFDTDYSDTPLGTRNVEKNLICQNNMFQSVTEEKVDVSVTARHSDGRCSNSASRTISAEYYVVQSGDLTFDLARGPVYSGRNFTFDINYTNSVRWYYGDDIDTCPAIYVPNSEWGSYSCHCHTTCSGEGENRSCNRSCSTCYGCVDGATEYPDNCHTLEDAKKLYEAKIPRDIYIGKDVLPSNKTVTLPKDSNSVANSNQTANVGKWTCTPTVDLNGNRISNNRWSPGEEWITKCRYTLPSAQLNVKTADVAYNKNYRGEEWINEGNSYFIPLKWPTGSFPVLSNLKYLSSIKTVNWTAKYECDVEVKQMLYDLDDGGYLFFYRPISLLNPFPDRTPSTNWIEWWNNEANQRQLNDSYNNLEYTLNLSPSNLRDIRVYNSDKLRNAGNLGYLDYSINPNGTSNFFSQRYVSTGFNRSTSDYTRLGAMSR